MIVSYLVSSSPQLMAVLFGTALKWVVIFAPLVAVIGIGFVMHRVSTVGALALLHGFAALMGISFAMIFVIYTMGSIVTGFMGAAVLFGTMSFYGYFTKTSLDSWGKYLFVGLIAIIIASIINIFLGSTLFQMVISAAAIVIFLGLTAYDTQDIREQVSVSTDNNVEIRGALRVYLDFIIIFIHLLQLFGGRK